MLRDLAELFQLIYFILLKGGWIVLVIALLYMFYKLYIDYINLRWYHEQTWSFLKISPPQENEKSPLAFEQIFNQLHSIHATRTLAETYLEGQFQIWFVWEIVSIGGSIGMYARVLEKHRDTLESAIYAQFPDAEITEGDDYFGHFPKYDIETSDFDIFGFSFILKNDDAYPIRTYYDFEHSTTETFVDPVDGVWEELGKLNPYELFIIQYIFQPVDDDWKKAGYKLVQKLKGAPVKEKKLWVIEILGKLLGPILDVFIRPTPATTRAQEDKPPPSLMLHLTGGEKDVITAIEKNLSKLGYRTKIRCLYLAPKEKYNPVPVYTAIIGAYKSLLATQLNGLKPDTDRWTKIRYWVLKDLEKPILDLRLNFRKRKFWNMIRRRWFLHGPTPFVFNSEEIATILHFPQTQVKAPPIERVTVTKVQPPPELPTVLEI